MIVNKLVTQMTLKGIDQAIKIYDRFSTKLVKDSQSATGKAESAHDRAARKAADHWTAAAGRMRKSQSDVARSAQSSASKVLGAYSKAFSKLGSFKLPGLPGGGLSGLVGALGAGAAGGKILSTAVDFEGLKASLVTATGSTALANKEFARLSAFAAEFPSELGDVVKAYVRLKNLGLDPSNRAMKSYGNMASAMNKDLMSMIEAVADASTGEFERLKEFGIKASKNGDTVAFTFRKQTYKIKNDAAAIEQFLMGLGEKAFGGGMERQSKTIGGAMANLSDSVQISIFKMWEAGLKYPVTSFVKDLTEWVKKATPQMIELGKKADEWAKRLTVMFYQAKDNAHKLIPVLEVVAAAAIGIGAAWLYVKSVQVSAWLGGLIAKWILMDGAQKAVAISGALANAQILAIPILIGAAVAAVVWFGYQVYKYMTQGQKGIDGLQKKFPWLTASIRFVGDQLKIWIPVLQVIGKVILGVVVFALKVLWEVFKALWKVTLGPFFGWLGDRFKEFGFWIGKIYDYSMPRMVQSFYYVKDVVSELWDRFKGMFAWLGQKFPWLKDAAEAIGRAMGWVPDLAGTGSTSADVSKAATGLGNWDPSRANKIVASISKIQTRAGQCLKAVWYGLHNVMGAAIPASTEAAADYADRLASSGAFQEIKGITPQMLNDPQIKRLLQGATAIYDRGAAFTANTAKWGHAEIWDTMAGTANFGRGAVSLKNRTAYQLQHARIFVPVQAGTGGHGAQNIQQIINVNVTSTNASPSQIAAAAQRGVNNANGQSMASAAQQNRRPTVTQ